MPKVINVENCSDCPMLTEKDWGWNCSADTGPGDEVEIKSSSDMPDNCPVVKEDGILIKKKE
jgi:hypothetical protein